MGADISDVKQNISEALADLLDVQLCELLDTLHETVKGDNDLTDVDADQYADGIITWQEETEEDPEEEDGDPIVVPARWTLDDGTEDWDTALAEAWRAGRDKTLEVLASAIESAKNA